MTQSAVHYPNVAANVDNAGAPAWTNVDNAKADDTSYAQVTCEASFSDRLQVTDFGFSDEIGATDTIDGIQVEIVDRYADGADLVDLHVQLLLSGSPTGDDKLAAGDWPTSPATATYGGSTDDWNASLTAANVRDSSFGVRLVVDHDAKAGTRIAYVDAIRITIWYTVNTVSVEATEATQAQTVDAPAAVQNHIVGVTEATQAHAVDAPATAQQHPPVGAEDATQAQTAEAPSMIPILYVSDVLQPHTVSVPAVTQHQPLAAQDATQGQTAESPASPFYQEVAAQDATHGQTADAPGVSQNHNVQATEATHAQLAEGAYATLVRMPSQEIDRLGYQAIVRFTVDATPYSISVADEYRDALWHDGHLSTIYAPSDSWGSDYEVLTPDSINIEINDMEGDYAALGDNLYGVPVTLLLVTKRTFVNGTSDEVTFTRGMTIEGYRRTPGKLFLQLTDIEDQRLDTLYPTKKYTADDWPELWADHVGQPVPYIIGTAVKMPCAYVENNSGVGPWRFAVCEMPPTGTPEVKAVYRSGRVVASTEYSVAVTSAGGTNFLSLVFSQDQFDFSGRLHDLETDVSSPISRNAATELKRVLESVSATVASANFAVAESTASSNGMFVDIGYGRSSQRTVRAIIEDLLFVLRGRLQRDSSGEYTLLQDKAKAAIDKWEEEKIDLVKMTEFGEKRPPATVKLSYRPSVYDPSELAYTIERSIAGGLGEVELEAPYIYDHTVADRTLCYETLRRTHNEYAKATLWGEQLALDDRLQLTNPLLYSGTKDWLITNLTRGIALHEMELLEYNADVYVYTSGTLPADASAGYQPDYSQTPPAAPTEVSVTETSTAVDVAGQSHAYAVVRGVPPTINWSSMIFTIRNDATGEIYQNYGSAIGGGYYGTTIGGLRLNQSHTLVAQAINAFGQFGIASAGDTFTAASDGTTPSTPTGVDATQGTGQYVIITWDRCTLSSYKETIIYRATSAGGTYSEIGRITGTRFIDRNVSYGSTYYYKVRHVSRSEVESALSSYDSATVSYILTTDIGSGAVNTGNVATDAISGIDGESGTSTSVTATSAPGTLLVTNASFGSTGKTIFVFARVELDIDIPTGTTGEVTVVLRRGTTTLRTEKAFSFGVNPAGGTLTFKITHTSMGIDVPSAGSYNYYIYAYKNSSSITVTATAHITLMEMKR